MKEASYYKKLKNKIVNCNLCPTNCVIKPGNFGNCKARKNIDGKLYSLVYAKPVTVSIDPIEKKPLFHFFPGSFALSIGTLGCNMHCLHCQNYDISQEKADQFSGKEIPPKEIVETAIKNNCKSIAYTYNEPTIFYEYVLETAKLARKKGIKNIMVTNGYINPEPLKELYQYIDAVNIDLKSLDEDFYKRICGVRLKPVLKAIKEIKLLNSKNSKGLGNSKNFQSKTKTHIELTNLIIPGYNDKKQQIEQLVKWVKENTGVKTPLHFSAFYPTYKLLDAERTSPKKLLEAKEIAKKQGLKHVYLGNTLLPDSGNTYCPKCNKLLIERFQFRICKNNIKKNACSFCGEKITGNF
jgi:pyruvate formate lyase activating enzyme